MSFGVEFADVAQRDVENIYTYISETLCNRQAATRFISALREHMTTLENMPESYPLANDEYLRNMGIRFIVINNYIAFYIVSYEKKIVYVLRVLYGRRNWAEILKNDIDN